MNFTSIFGVLLLVHTCFTASDFDRRLGRFVLNSLREAFVEDVPVDFVIPLIYVRDSGPLLQIDGTLSNVQFFGFYNLTELKTLFCSTEGGYCKFSSVLSDFSLRGNYNLSGSVLGVRPFSNIGSWSMRTIPKARVQFNFTMYYYDNDNGIIVPSVASDELDSPAAQDFLSQFPGLIDFDGLDEEVGAEVYRLMVGSIYFSLHNWYPLENVAEKHLKEVFEKTTLFEVLSDNKNDHSDAIQRPGLEALSKHLNDAPISLNTPTDRVMELFNQSIHNLRQDAGGPFNLVPADMSTYANRLLSAKGTLWDMTLSGFSDIFGISVGSKGLAGELAASFLVNVTLAGKYNLSGEVLGSVPYQGVGEFLIVMPTGWVTVDVSIENSNGYAVIAGNTRLQTGQYTKALFPGLFDDLAPDHEFRDALVESLGKEVLTDAGYGIERGIGFTILDQVRKAFDKVPLIELLNGSA